MQLLGGIAGGALVFFFYRAHFKATEEGDAKSACFCMAPNIRSIPQAFFCELAGTFLLVLPVVLMTDVRIRLPNTSGVGLRCLIEFENLHAGI